MSLGLVLFYGFVFYAAAGLCTASVFVACGITRVLPEPMSFSIGARALIFPGAAALWPYVLYRWLTAGRRS